MVRAYREIQEKSTAREINLRDAAFVVAIQRIIEAAKARGRI